MVHSCDAVRLTGCHTCRLFDFTTSTRTLYDNCGVILKNGDVCTFACCSFTPCCCALTVPCCLWCQSVLPGKATDASGNALFQNATAFLNYEYTHEGAKVYPFRSPFFTEYAVCGVVGVPRFRADAGLVPFQLHVHGCSRWQRLLLVWGWPGGVVSVVDGGGCRHGHCARVGAQPLLVA